MKPEKIIDDLIGQQGEPFPVEVVDLIEGNPWRKARSKWWPHSYIVRDYLVDPSPFDIAVNHIMDHGYMGNWFREPRRYFYHDGWVYFLCLDPRLPSRETNILNRVEVAGCYDVRYRRGKVPGQKRWKKREEKQLELWSAERSTETPSEPQRSPQSRSKASGQVKVPGAGENAGELQACAVTESIPVVAGVETAGSGCATSGGTILGRVDRISSGGPLVERTKKTAVQRELEQAVIRRTPQKAAPKS